MTVISEPEAKRSGGNSPSQVREISIAHSPDSDDAFMFYGLATSKVRVPGLRFTHTLCDIETLNQKARKGVYDVTAISFHAYPYIQDSYALMSCGGSVGEGYGPMIVSPRPFTQVEIKDKRIAVPGTLTTAVSYTHLFHRAAAALQRSVAGERTGRTRHWAAIHVLGDFIDHSSCLLYTSRCV